MNRGNSVRKSQENRIKDGRGQGYGKDYVPFIQASDNKTPGDGYLTRSLGWKTERIHHTLSRVEYNYLMLLSWMDIVVDIREQYPLQIERTLEIAEQLHIPHAHINNVPVYQTTDFMISIETSNGIRDVVRTVKVVTDLTSRTLELFEIERRYFEEQGLDWGIILESRLPSTIIMNIDWIFDGRFLDSREGLDIELVEHIKNSFIQYLIDDATATPIQKLCLRADNKYGLESGSCLFILKHMLANKVIHTDMQKLIRNVKPLFISKGVIK
ncbi:TnsA endonuclease N-terminal domain-containing protein [Paenibacillus sp. CGMCC 1.16610]|uniref:Heteromeric transposase endonuclease subunit TnsA n=1 Tax=Paenibacillus anseongense TaxID=2682845 RepID=A0ABW9U6F2_9BACL|nr:MULTISPECIES: TnsA endonuclease C-terminal domain-containing protein [Paenibacillus]MBA2937067.1 TnsA endonuclease N-terminal domain-containing protein [Paenibacillus sp. CGMCC 1.16610]MVQ33390.1 heteromeric transposase endonuclease subunit TnsA [Paenibacillus anseongense]